VSVENVVATIEKPRSHQGIFLPDKKNSEELLPARLETATPTTSDITKNAKIKSQSIGSKSIQQCLLILFQ
jgi:hypothetical protein